MIVGGGVIGVCGAYYLAGLTFGCIASPPAKSERLSHIDKMF